MYYTEYFLLTKFDYLEQWQNKYFSLETKYICGSYVVVTSISKRQLTALMFCGFTVHYHFSNLCQSAFLYSERRYMTTTSNSLFCLVF